MGQIRFAICVPKKWYKLDATVTLGVEGRPFDLYFEPCGKALLSSVSADTEHSTNINDNEYGDRFVNSMESCKIYGWFHGDYIIGIIKGGEESRTASFIINLKTAQG